MVTFPAAEINDSFPSLCRASSELKLLLSAFIDLFKNPPQKHVNIDRELHGSSPASTEGRHRDAFTCFYDSYVCIQTVTWPRPFKKVQVEVKTA